MSRAQVAVTGVTPPVGPFSAAVTGTPSLFLSGQVAQHPETGQLVGDDVLAQTRQVLVNVAALLASAGKDESDVLRVGVYLTDIADFAAVNEVYAGFFTAPYPARTAIAVTALPLGARVEMDVLVG